MKERRIKRRREKVRGYSKKCARNYLNSGSCRACGGSKERPKVQHCNKCATRRRRNSTLSLYGLSEEEYEQLAAEQNWVCCICGKKETSKCGNLHIDHDHNTGKVRGLLCGSCNKGLGLFLDSPELLEKAASYIRNSS